MVRRLAIASLLFGLVSAHAQDSVVFDGGGGNNFWLEPLNWAGLGGSPNDVIPGAGDDAIINSGFSVVLDDAVQGVLGDIYVGDQTTGVTNANGSLQLLDFAALSANSLRTGTDSDGGTNVSPPGNATVTLTDGTLTINETANTGQAIEVGAVPGGVARFEVGNGVTTPLVDYRGGRFDIGAANGVNATLDLNSGTIQATGSNVVLGQSSGATGFASATIGGGSSPALLMTNLDFRTNNANSLLTIDANGVVDVRNFVNSNNAARMNQIIINSGGTLRVHSSFQDRNGLSELNLNGGTLELTGRDGAFERSVDGFSVSAPSLIRFGVGSGGSSLRTLSVGEDSLESINSTLSLDIQPIEGGIGGSFSDWSGGSGVWDTVNPDDSNWLDRSPENQGLISTGTVFDVLQTSAPTGFDLTGGSVIAADPTNWEVLNPDTQTFQMRALSEIRAVPALASIFGFGVDDIVAGANPGDDLHIAAQIGANASVLEVFDVNSFTVNGDLRIGGREEGQVIQDVADVIVRGDVVFGPDGGSRGGVYILGEGTLTVDGDIIETSPGVDQAQLHIERGIVDPDGIIQELNPLVMTDPNATITVQRFSVGELGDGQFRSRNDITTTGTFAVGAGTDTSSGVTGRMIVDAGTINANDLQVAQNGSTTGEFYVRGGSQVNVTSGRLNVGGFEINGDDAGTEGYFELGTGLDNPTVNVMNANTEIGRGGMGDLVVNSGTFAQQGQNFVIAQAPESQGAVTVNDGLLIVGVSSDAVLSDFNMNEGTSFFTQNSGRVEVEDNFNLGNGANSSIVRITGGFLIVGNNMDYRIGDGSDSVIFEGGDITIGNDLDMQNEGTDNLLRVLGGGAGIEVGNDFLADSEATVEFQIEDDGVSSLAIMGDAILDDPLLSILFDTTESAATLGDLLLLEIDGMQTGQFNGFIDGEEVATFADGSFYLFSTALGDGNDIGLLAIPEPHAGFLLLLAVFGVAMRRRVK
ncbi:MAG: hypothetical protein AAGA58_07480 [Verrucomicrobiota bacterium]